MSARFQKCKVSGLQGFKIASFQSCKVSELQGFRVAGFQSCKVNGVKAILHFNIPYLQGFTFSELKLERSQNCNVSEL